MKRLLPILFCLLLVSGTEAVAAQQFTRDSTTPIKNGNLARRLSLGMRLSSVFDSNLDRDEESLDVYGVVAGGRGLFQHRGDNDELTLEYEAAFHRYARTTDWDRMSHKFRGLYAHEFGSRWTLGAESEIAIKGSSEDRTIGDQYILEPRLEYEFAGDSRLRLYGALRLRRYEQVPDQNASNRYLGAEFTQKIAGGREWEAGLRYEVNDAVSSRRYYRRWTWHTKFVTPVSRRDELEFELKLRTRVFPERFVDVEDMDVPRQDQRWIPSLVWIHAPDSPLGLAVQYEYETQSANDPAQAFKGHQLRLSLLLQVWSAGS